MAISYASISRSSSCYIRPDGTVKNAPADVWTSSAESPTQFYYLFDSIPSAVGLYKLKNILLTLSYTAAGSYEISVSTTPIVDRQKPWESFEPMLIKRGEVDSDPAEPFVSDVIRINDDLISPEAAYYLLSNQCLRIDFSGKPKYTINFGVINLENLDLQVGYSNGDVAFPTGLDVSGIAGSGYHNRLSDTVIQWAYSTVPDYTIGDWVQGSASFSWRSKAADSETWSAWTVVHIDSSAQLLELSSGYFPQASDVEWTLQSTTLQFSRQVTASGSFTTVARTVYTDPLYPDATSIMGEYDNTFSWSWASDSGNTPSAFLLEYRVDGGSWQNFATITTGATSCIVPADTFPIGDIEWSLFAVNEDGVSGPRSRVTSVIVVGKSPAPVVSANTAPFCTVSWTASGQEAYEVFVDGSTLGAAYGTGSEITLQEPLSDGPHTIGVRVQNRFGLWSEVGTVDVTISNQPDDQYSFYFNSTSGPAITLRFASVHLHPSYDLYIYRDDKLVAHTDQIKWTDILAMGQPHYVVLNRQPDGHYYKFDAPYASTASVKYLMIASLEDEPLAWLPLRLSEQSAREFGFALDQNVTLRRVKGADYPVAERSRYKTLSGSFDAAYPYTKIEEAAAFEALLGKTVVIKTPGGSAVLGVIASISKSEKRFFVTYSFAIARTHVEGLT